MKTLVTLCIALAVATAPSMGRAAPSTSLALVVGTNRGGPGQSELRFAEDDARQVAALLGGLGHHTPEQIDVLLHPSRRQFEAALDALATHAAELRQRGGEAQVVFYYSGHARANALNLGNEEFSLADLRVRLLAMPATVTVVVLDACQSGAISRVKGAEATADFSFNSVSHLNTSGIVVMASSTATELSQESESLRSSFFTHHLLVGLRGAGDVDQDGRVTLNEAYRYAYNQTLAATAATAVGSQHATLETGLRGKGEIVLSYPAAATARLELPASLAGELLVSLEPSGAVVAELHKAEGQPVRLALAPGRYIAIHRSGGALTRRCTVALADGQTAVLRQADCADVDTVTVAVKGGFEDRSPRERWAFFVAFGLGGRLSDRFTSRLSDFGFDDSGALVSKRFSLAATRSWRRHFAVGLELTTLDAREFQRHSTATLSGQDERFTWSTAALGAFALADYPLWRERFIPYVRAGLGLTAARSSYQERSPDTQAVLSDDGAWDFGYALRAAVGVGLMPWRRLGFFAEFNVTYAPTVNDLVGDVHDSGGPAVVLGLRGAL